MIVLMLSLCSFAACNDYAVDVGPTGQPLSFATCMDSLEAHTVEYKAAKADNTLASYLGQYGIVEPHIKAAHLSCVRLTNNDIP